MAKTTAPRTPKPMPRISVSASYVRLASTCMAVHDIRYYLNGIMIEPRPDGGAFLVATNGHHMIAIIDADAECSERTIIAPNKATLKVCPKVDPFHRGEAVLRTIEVEGETALAVTDRLGLLVHVQPRDTIVEGNFPDWRRVLPKWDDLRAGSPEQVQACYRNAPLAAIGKTFPGVQSFTNQHGDQLIQRWCQMDNVVHIVMPQRVYNERDGWAKNWAGLKP